MSKFFDWFDETVNAAKTTEVGKKMVAAGFSVLHTGGGCLVWNKDLRNGDYLWVCTDESGLGKTVDEVFLVGHYGKDSDGEALAHGDANGLDEALKWCAEKEGKA